MMNGFERYTKKTRRALFLDEMEQVVPWGKLCGLIEPLLPQGRQRAPAGGGGADAAHLLFAAMVQPVGPGGGRGAVRLGGDAQLCGHRSGSRTGAGRDTVCKFRHLLEEHRLGGQMLEAVNLHLQSKGVRITTGTIVDATIIHAPTSTKNREQKRDPEMHQTKKGNQWYFGMKAHVGVDSKTKLIHSALATPANVADATVLPELLHGEETRVWGDQAYRGQADVIHECAPRAQDCTHRRYRYKDPLTKWSERRTARNRRCDPRWSTCSG